MGQQREDDRQDGDEQGQVSEVGRLDETRGGGADATDKSTATAPDPAGPESDTRD